MNKNKFFISICCSIFLLLGVCRFSFCEIQDSVQTSRNDGIKTVFKQHALEVEGKRLEKVCQFDKALIEYQKAMECEEKLPKVLRGRVIFSVAKMLQLQDKYQEALDRLKMNPYRNPKHEFGNDRIAELEALVEYQKINDPRPVYEYLKQYQEKYQKGLPPNGYDVTAITTLIRLYDTIGDYDKGIAVVDECLEYIYKQPPQVKRVRTSAEAEQYIPREKDPNGVIRDYYRVREAFEQDKNKGTKGSATKALIQSHYFPW